MSWAEVVKINSDISGEPLNYTDYIYDISVFGANSYVMDPNNSKIWDELAFKSCYIYGHTGIHRYVYDRLTEENLDKLFLSSGNLGRQLNNFHSTDVFIVKEAGSSIEKVLPAMTQEAYTLMEPKIKAAFQRYCDAYFKLALLAEETGRIEKYGAYSFEEWMYEMFNEQGCETIYNCFDPFDGHWIGYLDRNEAFLVAVSSSETAINWLAERAEDERDLFEAVFSRLIVHASQNSAAIKVIAESDELLDIIVNDEVSMRNIAASTEGMMTVLQHQKFTSAVLKSTVAMNEIAASTVATPLIFSFFSNIATSSNALTTINNALTTINNNSSKIYEGQYFVDDLGKAKDAIDNAVTKIGESTTNAAMVDAMVQQFVNNTTYINAVCDNTNVLKAVFSSNKANSAGRNAITSSTVFHYPDDFKIADYYTPGDIIVLRNKTLSKNVEFTVENKGAYGSSMLIMPVDNAFIDIMKVNNLWINGSTSTMNYGTVYTNPYNNGSYNVIETFSAGGTNFDVYDAYATKLNTVYLPAYANSFYNGDTLFKEVDIPYTQLTNSNSSYEVYITGRGFTRGVTYTIGDNSTGTFGYRITTHRQKAFLPMAEEILPYTIKSANSNFSGTVPGYTKISLQRKVEVVTRGYGPIIRNGRYGISVMVAPFNFAFSGSTPSISPITTTGMTTYKNFEDYEAAKDYFSMASYKGYILPLIAMK